VNPLPDGYDVIISRDSLQHLPLHYTVEFLKNVQASQAKYVMIGNYLDDSSVNTMTAVGGYFTIDLIRAPFFVKPEPYMIFREAPTTPQKYMVVWHVNNMTWSNFVE